MTYRWRLATVVILLICAMISAGTRQGAVAKPAPSPSPSPTNPPTPYMPVEQVTNGTWDMILQPQNAQISYSAMKLKDVGNAVTGFWIADRKTVYPLTGTRDGKHLKLDIKSPDKTDVIVGSIDATIDGIADMVGTITMGKVETPFQGAQHSRVPPPVEPSTPPNATPTPY